jgi:hypothetical protein
MLVEFLDIFVQKDGTQECHSSFYTIRSDRRRNRMKLVSEDRDFWTFLSESTGGRPAEDHVFVGQICPTNKERCGA